MEHLLHAWPAWQDRHHGTTLSCWTYDALWEEEVVMFNSFAAPYESMQKRSDRFVCKLKDYSLRRYLNDREVPVLYIQNSEDLMNRLNRHCFSR